MLTTETCRHCGYRIPSDASICPGCGRRHGSRRAPRLEDAPPAAQPAAAATPVGPAGCVAVAGWLGLALGARRRRTPAWPGSTAWPRSSTTTSCSASTTPGGWLAVALAALPRAALAAGRRGVWVRRTRRNLVALGLDRRAAGARGRSPGWLAARPRGARARKAEVDQVWREQQPARRRAPPPRVVPAAREPRRSCGGGRCGCGSPPPALLAVLAGPCRRRRARPRSAGVAAIAAGALLVASARALYDVVGIITVAHAHAGERVLEARADLPWDAPWDDDEDDRRRTSPA